MDWHIKPHDAKFALIVALRTGEEWRLTFEVTDSSSANCEETDDRLVVGVYFFNEAERVDDFDLDLNPHHKAWATKHFSFKVWDGVELNARQAILRGKASRLASALDTGDEIDT